MSEFVCAERGEQPIPEVSANTVQLVEYTPVKRKPRLAYRAVKRCFDVVGSLLALIVLSPLFLVVAILIKHEDGGPVFYTASRVGENGKKIGVYKFRSMKPDADKLNAMLTPAELELYQREYKLDRDPRITRIGEYIRKSSIDELPQLINILCGDMSFVGPRPLVREELQSKYTVFQQKKMTSVKPGLTGLWQVNGRSDCTYESGERQRLELSYMERCSLWLDFKVLLKTAAVVRRKVGAR